MTQCEQRVVTRFCRDVSQLPQIYSATGVLLTGVESHMGGAPRASSPRSSELHSPFSFANVALLSVHPVRRLLAAQLANMDKNVKVRASS